MFIVVGFQFPNQASQGIVPSPTPEPVHEPEGSAPSSSMDKPNTTDATPTVESDLEHALGKMVKETLEAMDTSEHGDQSEEIARIQAHQQYPTYVATCENRLGRSPFSDNTLMHEDLKDWEAWLQTQTYSENDTNDTSIYKGIMEEAMASNLWKSYVANMCSGEGGADPDYYVSLETIMEDGDIEVEVSNWVKFLYDHSKDTCSALEASGPSMTYMDAIAEAVPSSLMNHSKLKLFRKLHPEKSFIFTLLKEVNDDMAVFQSWLAVQELDDDAEDTKQDLLW